MNEWAAVFMVLAMVGIPTALIVGLVIWLKRRSAKKNSLKQTFLDLPTLQWHAFTPERGGPSFRFTPETKSRNSAKPSLMEVALPAEIPCDLKVRLMTKIDLWGLRLGLGRTLLTGDSAFDTVFYVEATSENYATDLLGSWKVREALLQLIRIGFTEISWNAKKGRITAAWSGYSPDPERDIMAVGEAIQGLELIRDCGAGLEAGPLPDWKMRNNFGIGWCGSWAALLVACLAGGFLLGIPRFTPLAGNWLDCCLWCLPFFAAFLFPAWFFFRASPAGHKSLGLWILVVGALLAGAIYPSYFTLNGWLDQSRLDNIKLPVRGANSSRSKFGTSYYALISGRINGREVSSVPVEKWVHDQILLRRLDSVDIEYGAGWFGFPWAKAMHFSKRPRE